MTKKQIDKMEYTCDRCKKKEFTNKINEIYSEGYYLPEGWRETNAGDLCPDCFREYNDMIVKWKG